MDGDYAVTRWVPSGAGSALSLEPGTFATFAGLGVSTQGVGAATELLGLTTDQTAALGPINIRLLSPNAYRAGGTTPVDETHLPAQEISLQNLTPERPSSLVISIGQGAQPLVQATAQIELDDEDLAALERKVRGE